MDARRVVSKVVSMNNFGLGEPVLSAMNYFVKMWIILFSDDY